MRVPEAGCPWVQVPEAACVSLVSKLGAGGRRLGMPWDAWCPRLGTSARYWSWEPSAWIPEPKTSTGYLKLGA